MNRQDDELEIQTSKIGLCVSGSNFARKYQLNNFVKDPNLKKRRTRSSAGRPRRLKGPVLKKGAR